MFTDLSMSSDILATLPRLQLDEEGKNIPEEQGCLFERTV